MSWHVHPSNIIIMLKDTRHLCFFLAWFQKATSIEKVDIRLTLLNLRHKCFKNSFFPYVIVGCNKSSSFILNSGLWKLFNKRISFH